MSTSTVDPPPELKRLNVTPPLREYVMSLWRRREFALAMSVGELRAKHMNTVLGGLWHVLNPLLLVGVYWLIFGELLDADRGVDNFIGFLAVGIFVYQFSQRSFLGGAQSISKNLGLIRSLQFPRALLPISAVLREALTLRSASIVSITIVLITGEGVTWGWLLVPPIIVLQFMFNLGGALITARLADRVKDIANVLPFVFRLLFYLSGVLFLVDRFVTDPTLKALFVLNPFYCFVSLPRDYLMTTVSQDNIGWMWLSAGVWSAVLLLVGLVFFRAGERGYGRG